MRRNWYGNCRGPDNPTTIEIRHARSGVSLNSRQARDLTGARRARSRRPNFVGVKKREGAGFVVTSNKISRKGVYTLWAFGNTLAIWPAHPRLRQGGDG